MVDEAGMINKEDFSQFAKDTHLLDFETNMGDASPLALLSPRKTRKQPQAPKKAENIEENPDEKVSSLAPLCFMKESLCFVFYNSRAVLPC